MTPTVTKVVPADTRKTGGGLDRMGVAEVVEDHQTIQTQEGEMDSIRGSEGDVAPEATQGHRAPKDLGAQQDRPGWKGDPGQVPGTGELTYQLPNASTIAVENSLQYVGESLSRMMLTQQNVNRNMVDHLNLTAEAQDVQTHVLNKLVENTWQREFDKLFNTIPIYDGEDPDKFEPWLTQLENACIVGKRDVREAYAIYMVARKLHYYISNADTTIRSDHMPLRKFLMKNTKNTTVNNWAVAIEDYNLKFEYIKGIKNTLADTMSHLVQLDPDTALPPEPDHEEFGKPRGGASAREEEIHALVPESLRLREEGGDEDPFQSTDLPTWGLPDTDVREA